MFEIAVNPFSEIAGDIAFAIANPNDCHCGAPSVGCAVHEIRGTDNASFTNVCERHKGFEFAKLDGLNNIYL